MERAKGAFILLLCLALFGGAIHVYSLAGPICLAAGFGVVGWFVTSNSKKTAMSAAHALLGPVTIGLLLVTGLLLFFNTASASADSVSFIERTLLYISDRVPIWCKLSPGVFVIVIVCLTVFAYWIPRLKLVTRFVAFNKFSSKVTLALGIATSFTFFSNVAIVQPKVPAINLKVEALYRRSKEGERRAIDRLLAAKAVHRAFMSQQRSEREYGMLLVDSIALVPEMDLVSKQALAGYVAQLLSESVTLGGKAEESRIWTSPSIHPRSLAVLDEQIQNERAAVKFADEEVKAAKEALSYGNEELRSIAWSFIEGLIGEHAAVVDQFARPVIDSVIDKYFEQYTDPIVEKRAEAVRHLFKYSGSGPEAAKLAANIDTSSALARMNFREAELARNAAHQAIKTAQAAKMDAYSGDTARADAEFSAAESASIQAHKNADLAKAASKSMAKLSEAWSVEQKEAAVAAGAVGLLDASQSLQIAAETAEATKIAQAATEAVEVARAGKGAAEAADAAKLILKAIPK